MKDENYSNNCELSIRERIKLDKEIRRVSAEIRKEHPSDWREILKSTDVYKKRHNISASESQNTETKKNSKPIKKTTPNKNKLKKDIDASKVVHKKNVKTKTKDNLKLDSSIKELENIENKLKKNSNLIYDFFSEISNSGFLSFEKRDEILIKYSPIYKISSELDKLSDSHMQKIFSEFDNLEKFLKFYEDLINYTNLSDTPEDNEIRKINENALDEEINENEDFFKEITDVNKKRAIVIDEKNVRVNAGAGTGKTFTIQNKVKYLIERKGVSPDKILCLSYTVKGAADLDDKVNKNLDKDNEVKADTFHGFCRSVARDCKLRKNTDRSILEITQEI